MNENEEWRDIPNYEGLYQVSSLGKVKSLRDRYGNPREKILKLWKEKDGYLLVNFCKNGKKKTCTVHRLVANAFIENPNKLPMINHKNEIKYDNKVDNLEWCDAKYNNNYGTVIQRRVANTDYKAISEKVAEKQRNDPNKSKQVYQYSLDGKLIKIWKSTQECGRNGYKQSNVSACCRNCFNREGNNVYKGFIWSYVEIKK